MVGVDRYLPKQTSFIRGEKCFSPDVPVKRFDVLHYVTLTTVKFVGTIVTVIATIAVPRLRNTHLRPGAAVLIRSAQRGSCEDDLFALH